jgi:hypothetical protein
VQRVRAELELESGGSLEEEAHLRMHEVEQAVHDAEAEEAASGRDDSTVPAVIRPGSYGSSGSSGTPSKQDARWRRQMYPAGRIMHLVPARLVPGTAAFVAAAAAASSTSADAEHGMQPAAPAGLAGSSLGGSSGSQRQQGRHAAKLSISDLMAGEGLLGRLASVDGCDGAAGSQDLQQPPAGTSPAQEVGSQQVGQQPAAQQQQEQQQQQQQPAEASEEMVLLDSVPQQAYARIKLCRTVLRDHIIPAYLPALQNAVAGMRRQAGLPEQATPDDGDWVAATGQPSDAGEAGPS